MRPFRTSFRVSRALELPHSYAPQRTLRANHIRSRQLHSSPKRQLELPPSQKPEKPDPLEEWRNQPPSKWPNRFRLLFVPFIGALIYSMVSINARLLLGHMVDNFVVDRRLDQD
jgi:coproporphyrinogen III oxidase